MMSTDLKAILQVPGTFIRTDGFVYQIWLHTNNFIMIGRNGITKDLEKYFKIKSSEIKTCRFGDNMSPLSKCKCTFDNGDMSSPKHHVSISLLFISEMVYPNKVYILTYYLPALLTH